MNDLRKLNSPRISLKTKVRKTAHDKKLNLEMIFDIRARHLCYKQDYIRFSIAECSTHQILAMIIKSNSNQVQILVTIVKKNVYVDETCYKTTLRLSRVY